MFAWARGDHQLNNREIDAARHLNNRETDVPTAALNSVSSGDEVGFVLFVLFRNFSYRTRNAPSLPRMKRGKSLILLRFEKRKVLAYFHFVLLFRVLRGKTGGSRAKKGSERATPQVQDQTPLFPVVLSRTRTNRTSSLFSSYYYYYYFIKYIIKTRTYLHLTTTK
jgi:hypothetical protein